MSKCNHCIQKKQKENYSDILALKRNIKISNFVFAIAMTL